MNGTIYDEIKKNDNSKKKEKLRFFVAMVSSNLLVLILALSFTGKPDKPTSVISTPAKLTHPGFKMVIVPLSLLVELNSNAAEIPVTLMNKDKKILIIKAFLHEELAKVNPEQDATPRFRIEIPDSEVIKLSSDLDSPMIAIPELKLPGKPLKQKLKRVTHYEIDL